MRISTSMIFDSGVATMQKKTTDLLRVQQQLASGRRVLSPSDDPVGASQALEVSQAKDLNTQYLDNQKNAKDILAMSEAQMQSADDLLQRVHELTVQLGSPALSDSDRASTAVELRQRFDELVGIANQQDGTGKFIYAGFRGDTQPFSGSVDTQIVYNGDDGQRKLQISASRAMSVSDSGNDIFMKVGNASVPFATSTDPLNKGNGTIGKATVTDVNKWNAAANSKNLSIKFAVSGAPAQTTYDIVNDQGLSILTNSAAVNTVPLPGTNFQTGSAISLKSNVGVVPGIDLGAEVTISNTPQNGDTFSIRPTGPISIFQSLSDLIHAAEQPTQGAGQTVASATTSLTTQVAATLSNIATAQDNILGVRAHLGARMNELESLGSVNSQVDLNYQDTLSRLQDVDYTSAITGLNQNQVNLQAAQQSFMKISQLSLFNYL